MLKKYNDMSWHKLRVHTSRSIYFAESHMLKDAHKGAMRIRRKLRLYYTKERNYPQEDKWFVMTDAH